MLLKSKTIIKTPIFWAMTRPYPYMSDRTIGISICGNSEDAAAQITVLGDIVG